jgi:hypothetical protein
MQEYLLREYSLGAFDPLCKRICRSIKQDGTYICRASKDTWSVQQWTLNEALQLPRRSCVPPIIHILRVRVMLEISYHHLGAAV